MNFRKSEKYKTIRKIIKDHTGKIHFTDKIKYGASFKWYLNLDFSGRSIKHLFPNTNFGVLITRINNIISEIEGERCSYIFYLNFLSGDLSKLLQIQEEQIQIKLINCWGPKFRPPFRILIKDPEYE